MHPMVAVLATVDTKQAEAQFLRDELERRGCSVQVIDIGLYVADATEPRVADVSAAQVANAAGADIRDLREHTRRDVAMATLGEGAGRILVDWRANDRLDGVLAIGGNQGTAVAAAAMRALEFGVPKYIVSTVSSGNVRGYVQDADIVMAFSVGDLSGGPNSVTETVLRQAAAAVSAMAAVASPSAPTRSARTRSAPSSVAPAAGSVHGDGSAQRTRSPRRTPAVAITAFGNTQHAVDKASARLVAAGVDVVPFHASGASGSAMERFILDGMFDGVLDLTTHELLAELYPADIYAPVRPGRLTAAGHMGLPQVVVPGGLEYHCFAAADTIPIELRGRATHYHNPNNTNVRASAAELVTVARAMADRLNAANGPVSVLVPKHGWSQVGSPGGPLHDVEANDAFTAELRSRLRRDIRMTEWDLAINDDAFAAAAAEELLSLMGASSGSASAATHKNQMSEVSP